MSENLTKPADQEPRAGRNRRPPRSQRIHRRRVLALQRRTEKARAVTSPD